MKKKRKNRLTKHHIVNKEDGGIGMENNILILWREKHDCFHKLFHNLTLREAARVLLRADRMVRRKI